MNAHNDITNLQRQVDHLTHAAGRIRNQLADLHAIAYEPSTATTDPCERVSGGTTDHSPRSGPEAAKALWRRTETLITNCEAVLVGLERAVTGWFMVTAILEPTRGSLIPAAEHARLLAAQRARAKNGQYTPARLVDQPAHPSKGRTDGR